jgi:hypothetical protein
MAYITPSKFAGHDVSCPYEGRGGRRRGEVHEPKSADGFYVAQAFRPGVFG